jgi:hypothetical protein
MTIAVLISLSLLADACGTASSSGSPTATSGASIGAAVSNTGSGVLTRTGSGLPGDSGNRSAGGYSVTFARCMRAHGVPNFPDPNNPNDPTGQGGQLGPDSGVDPTSAAFQAALNGPCRSLAPAGWVSSGSGPVTK